MNISINNQPSFKGKFIITGTLDEINKFDDEYHKKYTQNANTRIKKYNNYVKKNNNSKDWQNYFENIKELYFYDSRLLTDTYNENQKYNELLYLTNQDYDKYFDRVFSLTEDENFNVLLQDNSNIVYDSDILDLELREVKKRIAYKEAQKTDDSIANFLIDIYVSAREKAKQIFGANKAKDVKIIKASEALEALKKDRFDMVDGEIKNKNINVLK